MATAVFLFLDLVFDFFAVADVVADDDAVSASSACCSWYWAYSFCDKLHIECTDRKYREEKGKTR